MDDDSGDEIEIGSDPEEFPADLYAFVDPISVYPMHISSDESNAASVLNENSAAVSSEPTTYNFTAEQQKLINDFNSDFSKVSDGKGEWANGRAGNSEKRKARDLTERCVVSFFVLEAAGEGGHGRPAVAAAQPLGGLRAALLQRHRQPAEEPDRDGRAPAAAAAARAVRLQQRGQREGARPAHGARGPATALRQGVQGRRAQLLLPGLRQRPHVRAVLQLLPAQ